MLSLLFETLQETDLCWSAYGRNGVLFIRRGVAYCKTGLHGLLFIHRLLPPASTSYCSSTVNFLQPPPTTVHPRGPVHPASTGYYSSSPSRGPIHPASTG